MSVRDPGAATREWTLTIPAPARCGNCDHPASVHLQVQGQGRTSCAKRWATGRCGCKAYSPKEDL